MLLRSKQGNLPPLRYIMGSMELFYGALGLLKGPVNFWLCLKVRGGERGAPCDPPKEQWYHQTVLKIPYTAPKLLKVATQEPYSMFLELLSFLSREEGLL